MRKVREPSSGVRVTKGIISRVSYSVWIYSEIVRVTKGIISRVLDFLAVSHCAAANYWKHTTKLQSQHFCCTAFGYLSVGCHSSTAAVSLA